MTQNLSPVSQAAEPGMPLTQPVQQEYFVENLFSLAIIQKQTSTRITMDLHYNQLNTEEMPSIVNLLEENLPSVLATICYNDKNLPFNEEVQNTEIGHLFEHILLEYLCQHKMAKGAKRATYAGKTKWNWHRDPMGRFHIHLNCGKKDADILPLALDQTVSLMKVLLSHNQQPLFLTETSEPANGLKNGQGGLPFRSLDEGGCE